MLNIHTELIWDGTAIQLFSTDAALVLNPEPVW